MLSDDQKGFFEYVEAAVALMRRLGIRRMSPSEIELSYLPLEATAESSVPTLNELMGDAPSGDDLLNWSVSGPLPSEIRDASRPPKE